MCQSFNSINLYVKINISINQLITGIIMYTQSNTNEETFKYVYIYIHNLL